MKSAEPLTRGRPVGRHAANLWFVLCTALSPILHCGGPEPDGTTAPAIGGVGGPTSCGTRVCGPDDYCCNPSCGICAPLGGVCIAVKCDAALPPSAPFAGEPCGAARCDEGQVCCNASCGVCTPPGVACTQEFCTRHCASDTDCRAEASYCGGCTCLAVGAAESGPACEGGTVQCLADPCLDQRAVCADGTCTLVME